MVILDIGAVVKGYTGDLGRTVICGDPTPEQKEIYRRRPRPGRKPRKRQARRDMSRGRPARA